AEVLHGTSLVEGLASEQGLNEVLSGGRQRHPSVEILAEGRQGSGAEKGHAHGLDWPSLMHGVDGHNVGVLQLSQRLRLADQVGGPLEGQRALGEVPLPGENPPAKGATSKPANELEAKEAAPRLREERQDLGEPGR